MIGLGNGPCVRRPAGADAAVLGMMALKILALGPNPALQRVLTFDNLELGQVNRAATVDSYVGGKGQGMALALQCWKPGAAAVAHFLGGDNGRFVEDACASAGLDQVVEHTAAATRICTTLLSGVSTTELIDPSGSVSEAELSGLLEKITTSLDTGGIGGLALCGTTPPGADKLYGAMAQSLMADASRDGVLLLLDGFKNVDAVLASGRVDVLKINVDEAKALTKQSTAEAAAEALLRGDAAPLTRPKALLALTDGPKPAKLFGKGGEAWTLTVPTIECVNPIGAGDTCTGVFLHELASGVAPADAFAMGLAAACARCTHSLPATFTREEVQALRDKVVVEKVA